MLRAQSVTPPATPGVCSAFIQEYSKALRAPSVGTALVELLTKFFLANDSVTHITLPEKLQTRLRSTLADLGADPASYDAQLLLQSVLLAVALLQPQHTADDVSSPRVFCATPPPLL
jgi:hypothetical protein